MSAILPTISIDRTSFLARHFMPHQLAWILAEDEFHQRKKQVFALAEKSVRIGWTYADAFKNIRKRLHFSNRDYLFATKDYPSALEYMRVVREFLDMFDFTRSMISHGEDHLKLDAGNLALPSPREERMGRGPACLAEAPRRRGRGVRHSSLTSEIKISYIKFDNHSRIIAFSAHPQAMAVYGGDVGLDEFAKHPNAELLWQTAQGRVTWGYDMAVWSSHEGDDTLFHQFALQARASLSPSLPRRSRTDAGDGERAGLPRRSLAEAGDRGSSCSSSAVDSAIRIPNSALQVDLCLRCDRPLPPFTPAGERTTHCDCGCPIPLHLQTPPSPSECLNVHLHNEPPSTLPLPKGEGWGEGESDARQSASPNPAQNEAELLSAPSSAPPVSPWNLYFKVTISDAIELGLLDTINRSRDSALTPGQFIADCRARSGLEQIFQQAYMCNPVPGGASIVEWSAIERCRSDYEIERLHLEHNQIIEKFGEFATHRQVNREEEIGDLLRTSFPQLFGYVPLNERDFFSDKPKFRLGFDVAASGQGDLAAIYIDEADGDELWLRALFTCRTEDWHFIQTALFYFLKKLRHLKAAGDDTGLGKQICWETHASKPKPVRNMPEPWPISRLIRPRLCLALSDQNPDSRHGRRS